MTTSLATLVIWRLRRKPHFVSCILEQLGEECFELRLYRGKALLLSEIFDEPVPLLARAEQLRAQYDDSARPARPATPASAP